MLKWYAWADGKGAGQWHVDFGVYDETKSPLVRQTPCGLKFAIGYKPAPGVKESWLRCDVCAKALNALNGYQ